MLRKYPEDFSIMKLCTCTSDARRYNGDIKKAPDGQMWAYGMTWGCPKKFEIHNIPLEMLYFHWPKDCKAISFDPHRSYAMLVGS